MNQSVRANPKPKKPFKPWSIHLFGFALAIALLTSGCSSITRIDQPKGEPAHLLKQGQTAGQSFTARFGGLESVHFFLQPERPGEGRIIFRLLANEDSQNNIVGNGKQVLRRSVLPLDAITTAAFYKFDFPALGESQFKDYYAFLEIEGEGQVLVASAPPNSYLDGAYYESHQPIESQAVFGLGYDPILLATGLFHTALSWSGYLLAGAFLLLLPGWGLLSVLFSGWKKLAWPEKVGLAAGLSLSLYPLLLLWAYLVGIKPGALLAWFPPLLGLGLLLSQAKSFFSSFPDKLAAFRQKRYSRNESHKKQNHSVVILSQLGFLLVATIIILSRFWAVRGLEVPMLGDSYQHTMITQLLLDNRGLFDSWQPYTELNTFTYHFGFHGITAAFAWISHLPAPQAVLWTGQIINILAVLSLYPLATKIGRNPWAGVAAVMLAGLLMPMPMAYTNWGRYTQLAGQAALPAATYLLWAILERKPKGWSEYLLGWIMLSGIALLHYRVLIFILLFLPALILFLIKDRGLVGLCRDVFLVGIGSLVLFMPWLVHIYGGAIAGIFTANISTPASQLTQATQQYNAIENITAYLPGWVWLSLPLILAWSYWRQERGATIISLWWVLIILSTNPHWLGLPGTGSISNFAIAIAAYIPAGVLLGGATGWLLSGLDNQFKAERQGLRAHNQGLQEILLFFLTLFFALIGFRQMIGTVNVPAHAMVTRPDLRASAWILKNTPKEAIFLVNSFRAFSGSVVVGSDAGWWLPLLAHRQTTLPPLSYGLEIEPWAGYRKHVGTLTDIIQNQGILHPDSIAELRERKINFVYIGQQQGSVNNSAPAKLDPAQMLTSQNFKLAYHQDRVWIFEFIP